MREPRQRGSIFDLALEDAQQLGIDVQPRQCCANIACQTGAIGLDLRLGGLVSGIIEIYGEPGAGKTTLLGCMMQQAQQEGLKVGLLASEYLDEPRFRAMGVDTDILPLVGRGMVEHFVEDPATMLAIDSISALRPEVEEPGVWRGMVNELLYRIKHRLGKGSCVVVTSQVRARRSKDPGRFFSLGTQPDCRLDDPAEQILELSRAQEHDDSYLMDVNIVANCLGRPATIVQLPVIKRTGIDRDLNLVETALELGVLVQRGAHIYLDGRHLAGGREEMSANIQQNRQLGDELERSLRRGGAR